MRLTRYDDVRMFYDRAGDFLEAHEAEHNLPLGICGSLLRQPDAYADTYFTIVDDGDTGDGVVIAVSLRTPPHNLVLSLIEPGSALNEALALIARDAQTMYGALPGALGTTAIAAAFAAQWQALTGVSYEIAMKQRIYKLTQVIPPAQPVTGAFRYATEADIPTLTPWLTAFEIECGVSANDAPEQYIRSKLTAPDNGLVVWEDGGKLVTMVGYGGPTPHSVRIGPVYTPSEARGRGYASACTAAVSQRLLDEGWQFLTLFTDLANPTSNHIYQAIGYASVCDVDMYNFSQLKG
ncbi:MAG: GNAT family N-acetyltransferase [Ktedonobacterales bacterium]